MRGFLTAAVALLGVTGLSSAAGAQTLKVMKSLDMKVPDGAYPKFTIMGKVFDPDKPDAYLSSFAIKRA